MRFFSNDKDARDDQQGVDVQERADQVNEEQVHPERVTSDPVAVPPQRPGSPWSSTPDISDTSDAELAAQERADGTDEGRPPFHEPAPQPTAFGASTVGGAVAASAMAGPQNDTWSATARDSAADSGVGDDRTVAPGDGAVTGDREGAPAGGTHRSDPVDVALDDQGTFDDPQVRDADTTTREDTTPPDARRTDVAADGTVTDGGATTGTAAAGTLAGATVAGAPADRGDRGADRDPALRDDGTFDAPRAVDPATDRPLDDSAPAAAPVAAPMGAPAPAGTAASAGTAAPGGPAGSLFDADDARSFQERWRDVQLRFVDDPKEATAEAAGLLDEAVDRLATSLREQKGRLAGGTDDTERLRVELRGYRDMLNRILDL